MLAIFCLSGRTGWVSCAQHPRWAERPVLVVVLKGGHVLTSAALGEHLQSRVPRWWLPDAVIAVEAMPHTATGKIDKKRLREAYGGCLLPKAE